MIKERSVMVKVNQETYAVLFDHLLEVPSTCHDLADVTGLHVVTVQNLMRTLKRHKVVHIVGWENGGRTAVFTFGRGKNKPRPRKTRAQIAKDYRDRKRMRLIGAAIAGVA